MDQKTTYSYQRTPGLDCPKCGVYFPYDHSGLAVRFHQVPLLRPDAFH